MCALQRRRGVRGGGGAVEGGGGVHLHRPMTKGPQELNDAPIKPSKDVLLSEALSEMLPACIP